MKSEAYLQDIRAILAAARQQATQCVAFLKARSYLNIHYKCYAKKERETIMRFKRKRGRNHN